VNTVHEDVFIDIWLSGVGYDPLFNRRHSAGDRRVEVGNEIIV